LCIYTAELFSKPKRLKFTASFLLLLGGNTDLQGFEMRFSSDLRELLPEHSTIINVCRYATGNHSWNTVMGANAVNVPNPYGILLSDFSFFKSTYFSLFYFHFSIFRKCITSP
jgi:hypothetical protein